MFIVPIQEAKEELEYCSKLVTKSLKDEYSKDDCIFSSLFTKDQFDLILGIAETYASRLALELYEHVSTANLPAPSTHPEPQDVPDEHDPSMP